ncbi:MAG TPA: trehalase-like domain-containing protein, partial [Planctomycetota bacterium]|nr:trehalase-like domain-containing protein [Planctomycetota bacterium]
MPSKIILPSSASAACASPSDSYAPLADYGIIGDLRTVALVGLSGSIDFMCFPDYDSPSVFAALLDRKRGGCFVLAPMLEGAKHTQLYLPDTNVLLTRFLSSEGGAEVSDFMPLAEGGVAQAVIRRAKAVRGEIRFRMICDPRFDYGRAEHAVQEGAGGVVFASRGPDKLSLRLCSRAPLRVAEGAAVSEFVLRAGESISFVLEETDPGLQTTCPAARSTAERFKETVNYWRRWVGESTYQGRWREMVSRSAL